MASKNRITHEWNERLDGIVFRGTIRQPTLVEIHNYMLEQQWQLEGVYVVAARLGGEWIPPDENLCVELIEYGEKCPVCGKPFQMDTDYCPICHKKWNDE